MRACLTIRDHPTARVEPFINGLKACGYKILQHPFDPAPGDVLVIWNRYGRFHELATGWEAAGNTVIVAENGYTGRAKDCRLYAMALNHHNGAGRWHVGTDDRSARLRQSLQPWREDGTDILIIAQRGIGEPGIGSPPGWHGEAARLLLHQTKRPIRVREHPGNVRGPHKPPEKPLHEDLKDVWAALTWGSGAAIKALMLGVPVFHAFDRWIGAPAAKHGLDDLENPYRGDRTQMLHQLAWAQWDVDEIRTGEPFRHLLRLAAETQGSTPDAGVRDGLRRAS